MSLFELCRKLRRELCRELAVPIRFTTKLATKHLRRPEFTTGAILLLVGSSLVATAQDNPDPALPDFSEFRLIAERNIFNPDRAGRAAPAVNRTPARSPRVDSFTLVGTLGDGKRWIAFFDGTRSELRGRLQCNDSIGDYTLTAISNTGVRLDHGTNTIQLRVGMQLRREDDGPWLQAERAAPTRGEDSSSRQEAAAQTSTASTSTGATDNEVLLRLMQQREKELQ